MEYITVIAYILGTLTGVLIYRQGLKDKKRLKDNRELAPIVKGPIKVIKEVKAEKKSDEYTEGVMNLLSYDGTEQK